MSGEEEGRAYIMHVIRTGGITGDAEEEKKEEINIMTLRDLQM